MLSEDRDLFWLVESSADAPATDFAWQAADDDDWEDDDDDEDWEDDDEDYDDDDDEEEDWEDDEEDFEEEDDLDDDEDWRAVIYNGGRRSFT